MRTGSVREGRETRQKSLVASLPSLRVSFLLFNCKHRCCCSLRALHRAIIAHHHHRHRRIIINGFVSLLAIVSAVGSAVSALPFARSCLHLHFVALGIRILVTILFGSSPLLRRRRQRRRSKSFARSRSAGSLTAGDRISRFDGPSCLATLLSLRAQL